MFRLLFAVLPYILAIAGPLITAVALADLMANDFPAAPVPVAIADVEAGKPFTKWPEFSDGLLDWEEGYIFWKENENGGVLEEVYYVPYSSQAAIDGWSSEDDQPESGTILLVELSEQAFKDTFPGEIDGVPIEMATPYSFSGKASDNTFDIPDKVEDAFKGYGFDNIYIVEPGSEPASKKDSIIGTAMLGLVTLGAGYWSFARIRDRNWFGGR